MQKISKSNVLYIILSVVIFATLILFPITLSYFGYLKVYDGEGYLPILNVGYVVVNGDENSLKNIQYEGQTSQNVQVKVTTKGNNISGFVRAKIICIWTNNYNNRPEDENGDNITACEVKVSSTDFNYENGYYYSNQKIEPDSEVNLVEDICFGNLPDEYRTQKVSIEIIVEIVQSKENW